MPKREEARAKRSAEGERSIRARGGSFEKRVNPNRTDGQGGYFVPPLWLVDEFVAYLRAGRTTANLPMQLDLPTGTDSINLPKVLDRFHDRGPVGRGHGVQHGHH